MKTNWFLITICFFLFVFIFLKTLFFFYINTILFSHKKMLKNQFVVAFLMIGRLKKRVKRKRVTASLSTELAMESKQLAEL
jgi:hypothetical protein